MPTMVINIPAAIYEQLEAQARQAGITPEELTRELLETALHAPQAAGRVCPLSDTLRRQIILGVTLDEVLPPVRKPTKLNGVKINQAIM